MEAFLLKYAESAKEGTNAKKAEDKNKDIPAPDMAAFLTKRKRPREADEQPIVDKDSQIEKKRRLDAQLEINQKNQKGDPLLPREWSIFTPDPETATTTVFLAPSFSGKTSLIVEQLNRLTDKDLDCYTSIVLCTESISAAPLKKLDERVLKKMNILDSFIPEYVLYIKKTNTLTSNRFRYLVIMDDCLKLKGEVIINMILTLRNSGVSTAISIQYSKLLSPAQRQSIHDYYLLNLRLEDLEYLLTGFVATHARDRLNQEGDPKAYEYTIKKLAETMRYRLRDRRILHYDQRHDKINIYSSS